MDSRQSDTWTHERLRSELRARSLQDAAVVALTTTLCSLLAIHFEWSERFFKWTRAWESWQLDEVAFIALSLAIGLAWFSWRRWSESNLVLAERLRRELPELIAAQFQSEQTSSAGLDRPAGSVDDGERRTRATR